MDEAAGLDRILLPGGAREKTITSRVCLYGGEDFSCLFKLTKPVCVHIELFQLLGGKSKKGLVWKL